MARWVRCFMILILSAAHSRKDIVNIQTVPRCDRLPVAVRNLNGAAVSAVASGDRCLDHGERLHLGPHHPARKTIRKLEFQRKAFFLSVRDMALYILCVILSQCMTPAH